MTSAIAEGAQIFAGPETAERMNEVFRERGMDHEVISSNFFEEGELVAMKPWDCRVDLPLSWE